MGDPRVDACEYQEENESGKITCVYPNREYYFCKTNRRDNVCPLGYTTTYDEPEIKIERKFESILENQMRRFHESHITSRWNLKNNLDSFQLYYQLDLLQLRYFHHALLYHRAGEVKKSHYAWSKHDAYRSIINELFPYRDGGGKGLYEDYVKVEREIAEMETRLDNLRGEKKCEQQ